MDVLRCIAVRTLNNHVLCFPQTRDPLISSACCLQLLIHPQTRGSTKTKGPSAGFFCCQQQRKPARKSTEEIQHAYRRQGDHRQNDSELADDDAHLADSAMSFDLMQEPVERETSPKHPSGGDR